MTRITSIQIGDDRLNGILLSDPIIRRIMGLRNYINILKIIDSNDGFFRCPVQRPFFNTE